jgi:hypothetical protein
MRSGPTPKSYVPVTRLCKFYLRLLHPKAIAEKAAEGRFFFTTLIFEMLISGGSAKRLRHLFFGAYHMIFFFLKNIFCSTEDFRVVTFS